MDMFQLWMQDGAGMILHKEKDLYVEMYNDGHEHAVRITHLPTGLKVEKTGDNGTVELRRQAIEELVEMLDKVRLEEK